MYKFADYDTEKYYYQKLHGLGIQHISWSSQIKVLTKDIIDNELEDLLSQISYIKTEAFDEMQSANIIPKARNNPCLFRIIYTI